MGMWFHETNFKEKYNIFRWSRVASCPPSPTVFVPSERRRTRASSPAWPTSWPTSTPVQPLRCSHALSQYLRTSKQFWSNSLRWTRTSWCWSLHPCFVFSPSGTTTTCPRSCYCSPQSLLIFFTALTILGSNSPFSRLNLVVSTKETNVSHFGGGKGFLSQSPL